MEIINFLLKILPNLRIRIKGYGRIGIAHIFLIIYFEVRRRPTYPKIIKKIIILKKSLLSYSNNCVQSYVYKSYFLRDLIITCGKTPVFHRFSWLDPYFCLLVIDKCLIYKHLYLANFRFTINSRCSNTAIYFMNDFVKIYHSLVFNLNNSMRYRPFIVGGTFLVEDIILNFKTNICYFTWFSSFAW